MSSRSYTGRNRPVTACRECHRRKQKCDRLRPCNVCLARNVPEKCLYGDDVQKLISACNNKDQVQTSVMSPDVKGLVGNEVEPSASTFEEQYGYSMFGDNALTDLYKSINAIDLPLAGTLGQSTFPMRSSLKERYFKLIQQLPSKAIRDALIEVFFREANWYFTALDHHYFQRLHTMWNTASLPDESFIRLEQYSRDLQHFPALLFQVLAVGLQFSTTGSQILGLMNIDDFAACQKQSQLYSETGSEIMTIIGRDNPSITGVEHDIMRMTWLKNCSRGSESRSYIGNAVRQAQDLELHLESDLALSAENFTATPEQLWYEQHRRRVWVRVFYLDGHMNFVLGRPRFIHLDDCSAKLPIDCDIPDSLAGTRPAPPGPGDIPSSFTLPIYLYQLALKIHQVMSVKSKKVYQNDYGKVLQVQQDVEALLASLPPAARPQDPDTTWDQLCPNFPKVRYLIVSVSNCFLMRLHKPYVNRNDVSRDACIRAALGTLDVQQKLFDLVGQGSNQTRIYSFSFHTIDAAVLLSSLVIDRFPTNPNVVQHADRALSQSIERLGCLRKVSPVAASAEKLLLQCYYKMSFLYPTFFFTYKPHITVVGNISAIESGSVPFLDDNSSLVGTQTYVDNSALPQQQSQQKIDLFLDQYNFHDPQMFELDALPHMFASNEWSGVNA